MHTCRCKNKNETRPFLSVTSCVVQRLATALPVLPTWGDVSFSRLGQEPTFFTRSCVSLENCALMGYYAANSGNFLPTFWDNLSVPSSRFKNPKINNRSSLRNNSEERVSHLLRGGNMKSRTVLLGRLNREDGRGLNNYKSRIQKSQLYRNV